MREREILFNDFLSELRRKEKDEKHHKKEQVRKTSLTNALNYNFKKYIKISHNSAQKYPHKFIFLNCVCVFVCENFL